MFDTFAFMPGMGRAILVKLPVPLFDLDYVQQCLNALVTGAAASLDY